MYKNKYIFRPTTKEELERAVKIYCHEDNDNPITHLVVLIILINH